MSDLIAFCAPGGRFAAALTLVFTGQEVTEIREHPYLAEDDGVVVVSEPELPLWVDPDAFKVTFPEPEWPLAPCPSCGMPDLKTGPVHPEFHGPFCWLAHSINTIRMEAMRLPPSLIAGLPSSAELGSFSSK